MNHIPAGFCNTGIWVIADALALSQANQRNKMDEQEKLRRKLEELYIEHQDLDDVIDKLNQESPFDQLQIQRLKKRKLMLRDLIIRLEDSLLPDIIA